MARVLYVEGSAGVADLAQRIDSGYELVREASPTRALARLEADGDFAIVVCDENVNGSPGLELLAAVRSLSATSSRVLVSESLARGASPHALELVFRCLSPHGSASEWRRAMAEALDYHQLLATCPSQPVEAPRQVNVALPPPADLEPRPRGSLASPARHVPSQLSSWVDVEAPGPELILIEPSARRLGLQVVGRFVELLPGLTVVGRSRTCHIPIPDPQISRRHATFTNNGREVQVRNVSQTNGVRVNGVLIEREVARPIVIGDRIMLGSHEIELCGLGDYCPSFEPTESSILLDPAEPEPGRSSTLITLARVAEKYFALGQAREAERILRPLLEGLLRHCESRQDLAPCDVELATDLVLRIAEAQRAGEWINYLFALFSALERPVMAEHVEDLCRLALECPGVELRVFRGYLDVLAKIVDGLGSKERLLVRRIQGLEQRLALSAQAE